MVETETEIEIAAGVNVVVAADTAAFAVAPPVAVD